MADDNDPLITHDVVVPLGQAENGRMRIARIQGTDERPVRAALGEFQPLEEGVPITGEVIRLTPRPGTPFLDVQTEIPDPFPERTRQRQEAASGRHFSIPSQQFQDNWERIFGKKSDSEVN